MNFEDYIFTDYTELNEDDAAMVLDWRNSDFVRNYMDDSSIISIDDHLSYIERLKKISDKRYLLVKKETGPIGCISFQDITEDTAELGIFINPRLKGLGVGKELMTLLEYYAESVLHLKLLTLKVKKKNLGAVKLYKYFSYRSCSEDTEYLYMDKALV